MEPPGWAWKDAVGLAASLDSGLLSNVSSVRKGTPADLDGVCFVFPFLAIIEARSVKVLAAKP